jgi:BMFP domain-containing protein YqiC
MANQIETEQTLQNINLIHNILDEDIAGFVDDNSENVALIREILHADINALNVYVGEEDEYQTTVITKTINTILNNCQALKNELVVLDAQIATGDDVENSKFIRDILINDINELGKQLESLTDFSQVHEENVEEDK